MIDWPDLIRTAIVAVMAFAGAWYTARRAGQTDDNATQSSATQTQIDQLQEDVRDLRAEVRALKINERALGDYVEELRIHISEQKPPPPPPWPDNTRG